MEFSIITPSYNMLSFLKCCHASVVDQVGVSVEHIVVDGNSTDGTVDWLRQQENLRYISEKDNGMYDAVNKGIAMASGEIVAYLNCDEQYLPHTLATVKAAFGENPGADVIFGDVLLVDASGEVVAYRKSHTPRWYYIQSARLYLFTAATFFRRRVFERGYKFDPGLKMSGDAVFYIELLRDHVSFQHHKDFLSVFAWTGDNLSGSSRAEEESAALRALTPAWVRLSRYPLNALRLLEKLFSGAYWQRSPIEYEIYHADSLYTRTSHKALKVSNRWPA